MNEIKSSQVNLRLQPSLKEAAEKAAAHDHRSLTSLIEKLLSEHIHKSLQPHYTLEEWHRAAYVRFKDKLIERKVPGDIDKKCRILSYFISRSNGESLDPPSLLKTMQQVYDEKSKVVFNSRLFRSYADGQTRPHFTFDSNLPHSAREEILEHSIFPDKVFLQNVTEFWRVSPSGFATHIRPYPEDHENTKSWGEWEPGKKFCPYFLLRDLVEIVLHAYHLSQKFSSPAKVTFCCESFGLLDRELDDPDKDFYYNPGKTACIDHHITIYEYPADDLSKWPEAVSVFGAPIMRLFHPEFDFSPDRIRDQIPRLNLKLKS